MYRFVDFLVVFDCKLLREMYLNTNCLSFIDTEVVLFVTNQTT